MPSPISMSPVRDRKSGSAAPGRVRLFFCGLDRLIELTQR